MSILSQARAVVVCVEYDDLLAMTLPRFQQHFADVLVVTSPADTRTQALVAAAGLRPLITDAFYRQGATFNKGLAVEEAFDRLGREGWLCALDADIVLPATLPELEPLDPHWLYGTTRLLLADPTLYRDDLDWATLPQLRLNHDISGYFQLFHAASPRLYGATSWYGRTWLHAGGCDTAFSKRWPREEQKYLPFPVLHLGPARSNWCGRVSPRTDGSSTPEAAARNAMLLRLWEKRDRRRGYYDDEHVTG